MTLDPASYTYDRIRAAYERHGYRFYTAPQDLNLFGIRGPERNQSADRFDDLIGYAVNLGPLLIGPAGQTKPQLYVKLFPATTDPGLVHLTRPTMPEQQARGTAILVAGQYKASHQIGWHGTGQWRHPALVQVGNVTVWRDNNRDAMLDIGGKTSTGLFGINIHAASLWQDLPKIGAYSAGCQVLQSAKALANIMGAVSRQAAAGLGTRVSYTLFNSDEI